MGDVFYGKYDCDEINGYNYKKDAVIECMRREGELKALKKKQKRKKKWWNFFDCFEFVWILLGGGTTF